MFTVCEAAEPTAVRRPEPPDPDSWLAPSARSINPDTPTATLRQFAPTFVTSAPCQPFRTSAGAGRSQMITRSQLSGPSHGLAITRNASRPALVTSTTLWPSTCVQKEFATLL